MLALTNLPLLVHRGAKARTTLVQVKCTFGERIYRIATTVEIVWCLRQMGLSTSQLTVKLLSGEGGGVKACGGAE